MTASARVREIEPHASAMRPVAPRQRRPLALHGPDMFARRPLPLRQRLHCQLLPVSVETRAVEVVVLDAAGRGVTHEAVGGSRCATDA